MNGSRKQFWPIWRQTHVSLSLREVCICTNLELLGQLNLRVCVNGHQIERLSGSSFHCLICCELFQDGRKHLARVAPTGYSNQHRDVDTKAVKIEQATVSCCSEGQGRHLLGIKVDKDDLVLIGYRLLESLCRQGKYEEWQWQLEPIGRHQVSSIRKAQSPSTPCQVSVHDGSHLCVGIEKMVVPPSCESKRPNRRSPENALNRT